MRKNISFSYGKTQALENVSIRIKHRSFVSIMGPNGGGKTTFLKLILGIFQPDCGELKVFGLDPKDARKYIGYVPQINEFNKDFPATVLEVVLMGMSANKLFFKRYTKHEIQTAHECLRQVDMIELKDRQINQLSGGQIQRVLIARALARGPKILLLDEPISNVDSKMQKSIYALLKKLKQNMTIIIVTHDITTTSAYVDEIACLNVKLHHHGDITGAVNALSNMSNCPVEILAHGVAHRVLGEHDD